MDAADELTQEYASRLAVTAVAADLEFWARNASVEGYVGLNDLIQVLDVIRLATGPDSDGCDLPSLTSARND
jgi:hypothetical protein